MTDPGQLTGAFLSGPQITADDVNLSDDLVAYYWWNAAANGGRGEYILATISVADLVTAMGL